MLGFWKFFLDNRAFTYFLVILSLVAGSYALLTIPKESTPEITLPIAVVNTSFFGASAADVEVLVTEKIEQQVANLSGVDEYESTSEASLSTVVVTFEQGEDIDERVTRLKETLDQIRGDLPADGNDPRVTKIEFSSQPIFTVSLVSELPLYSFKQVVDDLEDVLSDIEGVARVSRAGLPEREIAVVLDNRKLIQHRLDFNTVSALLSQSDVTLPGGSLEIKQITYPLDIESSIADYTELGSIPLSYTGQATLVTADVAEIINGFREQETITQVGFPGGDTLNAVTINISKKSGGDITKLAKEIRLTLDELSETTLQGVDQVVTYDAGQDIQENLGDLVRSGGQTVFLVFVILMIFVGLRESLIAAVSIPFSFLLAFIAFLVFGKTINFISLFSLILSVGILVDAAIVVTEGINSKVAKGMRRQEAAVATVREFGIPLFAGTMTTIAVFFPLLFLSGITGQFIRGIPFTVIFVLLASMFVSLGFVTVFCASFLRNRDQLETQRPSWANRQFARLEERYRRILRHLLQEAIPRRLFQVTVTLLAVLSIYLIPAGLVKVIFFPGGDIEFAYVRIEMENAASLEDTLVFTQSVQEVLQEYEYIESYVSTVGATSQFENDVITGDQYANVTLNIKREFQSEGVRLVDGLRSELESPQYEFAELVAEGGGPPTGAAVDVSFTSENTPLLRETVREAERLLFSLEGTENVDTTLSGNTSGFDIAVDRNAASRFGVSVSDIARTIRGATDGVELFELTIDGEDVPVVVRNRLDSTSTGIITNRITPDLLRSLEVINNRGESIVLGNIITIAVAEADIEITRSDGERVEGVTAEVGEDYNPGEVRAAFTQQLEEMVPQGVSYAFGGEQSEQDESFREVGVAFVAGIFLMFAILILQFGRWRQVLIIMSVLLYALSGVIIGLFISSNALSFPAILGTIALFGIVVNNSIILVSVFNNLRHQHPEWSVDQVVQEGSVSRLRPIILTTITTIIGVSPLLTASAIWAPIAYAIIFGLLACVFVTLLMVPILYRRLEGFIEGPWSSVWSWWINILILIIVPTIVLIAVARLGIQVELSTGLAMYAGIVIAGSLAYIFTHIRRK